MADLSRIDIGFQGGQTLAVRADVGVYEALVAALADSSGDRWHSFESDDSEHRIDLSQVVYVSRESSEPKVGF